jgi:hypothetical protein
VKHRAGGGDEQDEAQSIGRLGGGGERDEEIGEEAVSS